MSTATKSRSCRMCTGPLPEAPKTGRPSEYCGEACRRSAEFSIRRLNRRLENLEDRASEARIDIEFASDGVGRKRAQKRLKVYTGEATLLEQRLRELIE